MNVSFYCYLKGSFSLSLGALFQSTKRFTIQTMQLNNFKAVQDI